MLRARNPAIAYSPDAKALIASIPKIERAIATKITFAITARGRPLFSLFYF
jgi:hypothetical protein